MRKTYYSPLLIYSFFVKVKGKDVRISCTGGHSSGFLKRNSTYTTSDKDIQEAIEAHPMFGRKVFLQSVKAKLQSSNKEKEEELLRVREMEEAARMEAEVARAATFNTDQKRIVEIDKEETGEEVEKTTDSSPESQVFDNIFPDVTTVAGAQEVLTVEPYNCSASSINTKQKIHAKAEMLGVSFPNLNK